MPRSLEELLKVHSDIPEKLHRHLTASWQNFGLLLKSYRDCIHHYMPVDFGGGMAFMRRNSLRAWTTTVRIPDNPEVRSKKQFTFDLNRDALTYAWEVSDEIHSVAEETVETVEAAMLHEKDA